METKSLFVFSFLMQEEKGTDVFFLNALLRFEKKKPPPLGKLDHSLLGAHDGTASAVECTERKLSLQSQNLTAVRGTEYM